jgi:glycosyltransferase involved in cell wall biosynthesis
MKTATPKPVAWIVIPCFNEQEVLPLTAPLFLGKIRELADAGKISENSKVLFVNDGSTDKTWDIIRSVASTDCHALGLCLSRNRGHQNALLAGLMEARENCDFTISIDCDGQDDINAMNKMVDAYLEGCEVVYGVRSDRTSDTRFKRITAQRYYRLLRRLGGDIVYNHADYRLLSARALQALGDYREVNLFLRGMVPLVGFQSTQVSYVRSERIAGKSHYGLKSMIRLAFNGISSLSAKPLDWILGTGGVFLALSLIAAVWLLIRLIAGLANPTWAIVVWAVLLLGGLQLAGTGIVGEYVGRTYLETKQRPRYIVADRTWEHYERHYLEEAGGAPEWNTGETK